MLRVVLRESDCVLQNFNWVNSGQLVLTSTFSLKVSYVKRSMTHGGTCLYGTMDIVGDNDWPILLSIWYIHSAFLLLLLKPWARYLKPTSTHTFQLWTNKLTTVIVNTVCSRSPKITNNSWYVIYSIKSLSVKKNWSQLQAFEETSSYTFNANISFS